MMMQKADVVCFCGFQHLLQASKKHANFKQGQLVDLAGIYTGALQLAASLAVELFTSATLQSYSHCNAASEGMSQ
jgi:hypothetical protein